MSSINRKVLDELRALEAGGAPGLVRELIELFLQEADGHMENLRSGMAGRDTERVLRASHTLKGSSGNLGAMTMSRLCAELHEKCRGADWPGISEGLSRLEAEFKSVRSELETEKDPPPG